MHKSWLYQMKVWFVVSMLVTSSVATAGPQLTCSQDFGAPIESSFLEKFSHLTETAWQKSKDAGRCLGDVVCHPIKFIKENALSLSPFALVPISFAMGGDPVAGTIAGTELFAGLKLLDKGLDVVMEQSKKVVPPQYMVFLIAGTTNMPELAASQGAAIAGDALADVAATPLGSNPANLTLLIPGILMAMKHRAIQIGALQESDRFLTAKAFIAVLKDLDKRAVLTQLGLGGMFALDSILFQAFVRPQMQAGNYAALGAWLAFNIPLLTTYFYKNTFSRDAKWSNAIENLEPAVIEKFGQAIAALEKGPEALEALVKDPAAAARENIDPQELAQLREAFSRLNAYRKEGGKEALVKLQDSFKTLRTTLEQDGAFKSQIHEALQQMDANDVDVLFKLSKIHLGESGLNPAEKRAALIKLVAGITAIIAMAPLLDAGVNNITAALPGIGKSAAGFFIMSYITSMGELLTTAKLFEMRMDKGATKNISDSNAFNILLAKMALATSAIMMLIN